MSRFIGMKFTHDAAVALINDNILSWSLELEKFDNNDRYTEAKSLAAVRKALDSEGFEFEKGDVLCIDGWRAGKLFRPIELDVAGYWPDIDFQFVTLSDFAKAALRISEGVIVGSTPHVTGHVLGAYVMSPHAGEDCDVLMWDGGTRPTLYTIRPDGYMSEGQPLFNMYGTLYGIMGYYCGPFADYTLHRLGLDDYTKMISQRDWPGKLMSWIGHGNVVNSVVRACERAHHLLSDNRRPDHHPDQRTAGAFNDSRPENAFMQLVMASVQEMPCTDADVLRSIHEWMGDKLVEGLTKFSTSKRLIFVGGSALNIKWNSKLRAAGYDVWIPPCTNDSGSAIGAAASARWAAGGRTGLVWSVYCGPKLDSRSIVLDQMPYSASPRFTATAMTPYELGVWLAIHPEEFVCVLHGRAEIGPRALGHRSLFMSARRARAKDILNKAKKREDWRPVAPIVLEEDAPALFQPGTPDPFMLFDHVMTEECVELYPAICHLDGTARIQTVGLNQCRITREILLGHKSVGMGHGILCNTSANKSGSGFFPDLNSADEWLESNCENEGHIWDGTTLWTRRFSR